MMPKYVTLGTLRTAQFKVGSTLKVKSTSIQLQPNTCTIVSKLCRVISGIRQWHDVEQSESFVSLEKAQVKVIVKVVN